MIELFKEIWSTAKRNKLRTSLTGFAVAWGIFMLIFLLGAGNGLINANLDQSGRFLANSMKVFGIQTSKAHKGHKEGRWITLNERDVNMTDKTFAENTEAVGSVLSQYGLNISLGENYVSAQTLSGVYPSEAAINKREIVSGRFINDIDMKERRKVIALWQTQAKELAKNYLSLVGRDVKVGDLMFKVIGIVKDDKQRQNNEAFIPYTTLKAIYAKGDEAGDIQFEIKGLVTEAQNKEFESNYRAHLNNMHDAAPDDEAAVYIWNRYMDNIQMAQGISIIRTALWIIGLFTLLSGIVGVSNIMLITVKERTREFGVRKAIGAKPWQILKLIITESVITTAIFGYIGMLCGIAANEYMDATIGHEVVDTGLFQATMFLNPTVGLDVCIQATLVIIIAGTIAGLIPALKAARVRPIEALRAE
ncbi:MAG: ABC transporter permease [Prevotella sp.]|nr:ABC transporter permease [Prevotella sp.]